MSDDFEIKGADQFKQLARALEDVDMRKALQQGIRKAVKEHAPVAAEALAAVLPRRIKSKGEHVSQSISVNASRDPGVTVGIKYGASSKRGIGAANAQLINRTGMLRHRVFGTNHWVDQHVGGQGWFDKSWTGVAPHVRAEIEHVVEDIEDAVVKKVKR